MHFNGDVSIGNLLTLVSLIFVGAAAWRAANRSKDAKQAHERAEASYRRDLEWRITNLENWRKEHMIDADARDKLLMDMKEILAHVRWQTDYMLVGAASNPKENPPKKHL